MVEKLEATRSVLETTAQRWTNLVETLPEELLRRPPLPGEWSAADCLYHLVTVERDLLSVRMRHILEGRPELVPYFPNGQREVDHSPRELLAMFQALRSETLKAIERLDAEDLNRTSFHPEYSVEILLGNLLDVWAAHDLQHTVQAEEALMQAFIPGTSVWRPEFADHDVELKV